jgi:hypothetical protein
VLVVQAAEEVVLSASEAEAIIESRLRTRSL